MGQALQDAKAIKNGEITRDQLTPERQANLDAARDLAKTLPPEAVQAKLEAYQAIKKDSQELQSSIEQSNRSCVLGVVCGSNSTLAKVFGGATALTQGIDATFDALRASKLGGPAVTAIANGYKTIREIEDGAFATGEAGRKAFGEGGLHEISNEGGLRASMQPPGAEGGEPGRPNAGGNERSEPGGGESSRPPGAGEGKAGGESKVEQVTEGLKFVGKGSDTLVKSLESPRGLGELNKIVGVTERAGREYNSERIGEIRDQATEKLNKIGERPESKLQRGADALTGVSEAGEAYKSFTDEKGPKWVEGGGSTAKSIGNFVKAYGKKELGEQIEAAGDAVQNYNKSYEAGGLRTGEGVSQYIQGTGNLIKIANKDAGSAVQNVGKMVGTLNQIQQIRQEEQQLLQNQNRMNETMQQRIDNVQKLQELQQLEQQLRNGGF